MLDLEDKMYSTRYKLRYEIGDVSVKLDAIECFIEHEGLQTVSLRPYISGLYVEKTLSEIHAELLDPWYSDYFRFIRLNGVGVKQHDVSTMWGANVLISALKIDVVRGLHSEKSCVVLSNGVLIWVNMNKDDLMKFFYQQTNNKKEK